MPFGLMRASSGLVVYCRMALVDLRQVKRRAEASLLALPGVSGVGLGDGTIRVYLQREGAKAKIPNSFEGVPVELVFTGDITSRPQ
jgi:hypothetical protein